MDGDKDFYHKADVIDRVIELIEKNAAEPTDNEVAAPTEPTNRKPEPKKNVGKDFTPDEKKVLDIIYNSIGNIQKVISDLSSTQKSIWSFDVGYNMKDNMKYYAIDPLATIAEKLNDYLKDVKETRV